MRARLRLVSLALLAFTVASLGRTALAAGNVPTEITTPAGTGLKALAVRVDAEHRVLHVNVGGAERDVPIELSADEFAASDVTLEALAVGATKRVVHARVPSKTRSDVAWEAVIAGKDAEPLWAGVTGYSHGEPGERTGVALDLGSPAEAEMRVIVLGELREDLRICGQARTLLAPRVLDAATMTFRGATMQRLTEAQRDGAEEVLASAHGGPADRPLARLLVAAGASTALGAPAALSDGDPATTWSEGRGGDGHGEFVTLRAPAEVPIARLAVTIAPPAPSPAGAAPRSFFLVSDERTIAVSLPEDAWLHPGAAYEIPLVDPLRTSCLSLILDKAYAHAGESHPDVTVAELTAYSAFDGPGATLDQVAKALAGGGARSDAAKEVLERAGEPGLTAAAAAYGGLDAAGRALAVDAAIGAGTCEASASLLLAAMGDKDREVARKGGEKLERCGKRAVPALLAALGGKDESARANAARLLAVTSPGEALEPLVTALGIEGSGAETRRALRSGIAKAAARGASAEKLAALVRAARPGDPTLDLLRALEGELPRIAPDADRAVGALETGAPSMRTRFLLAEPLATLASGGDAAAQGWLASLIKDDPEPAVRARGAEVAARVAGAPNVAAALTRAIEQDASPRVRAAALEALTSARPAGHAPGPAPPPLDAIARRLKEDEWTLVRSAAAAALASLGSSPRVDEALERALADRSGQVREQVILALAAHGDMRAAKGIRARLEDERETLDVRLAAIKAAATLCDREALAPLTKLARRAPLPMATDDESTLGLAATVALGLLHPADLAARLDILGARDARPEARAAATRALATAPACR